MNTPHRFAAPLTLLTVFALLALLAVGCTDDSSDAATPTEKPDASATTSSPQKINTTEGTYEYVNAGLRVTMEFEPGASTGTLTVDNRTGGSVPKPSLYVRKAVDGKQVDGEVLDAAAVPDGERAEFEVEFPPEVTPDAIGLLILLIGGDNYGAFVHT